MNKSASKKNLSEARQKELAKIKKDFIEFHKKRIEKLSAAVKK